MFRQSIYETPFRNDMADAYFRTIVGDSFDDDYTFLSTARALIAPRKSEEDMLYIRFGDSSLSSRTLNNGDVRDVINNSLNASAHTIYIHSFNYGGSEDDAALEYFDKHFLEVNPNYKKLDKVTLFFQKIFKVICFVCPETKSVAIYTVRLRMQHMHYLQCGMLAYLPWYFNKEDGISEIEMELIESLRMKTSTKYEETLERMGKEYDFRDAFIRIKLEGFETKFEQEILNDERGRYRNVISNLDELNRRIGERLQEKIRLEASILGLETKIENGGGESEIMDYFIANKKVTLLGCDDAYMRFAVKDYLQYWDEDMAESMIDNKRSYLYRNSVFSEEDTEKFFKSVFIDEEVKMKICGAYTIRIGGEVSIPTRFAFGREFKDAMPNPHTDEYACLGNYQRIINDALIKRDYITAVEQCVASCKSLNFGDSTVMEAFVGEVFGQRRRNNKCFELPDGKIVDPEGVIEYLNTKDVKKEEGDE